MSAGYSGTPLVKKLGYKEGFRIAWLNAPEHYPELLGETPAGMRTAAKGESDLDLVHLFCVWREDFERELLKYRSRIRPAGMIWVSWPKKASKVPTDLTEDAIRGFALANRLVDVKVCAVDEVWSGLKLVIPVHMRE